MTTKDPTAAAASADEDEEGDGEFEANYPDFDEAGPCHSVLTVCS